MSDFENDNNQTNTPENREKIREYGRATFDLKGFLEDDSDEARSWEFKEALDRDYFEETDPEVLVGRYVRTHLAHAELHDQIRGIQAQKMIKSLFGATSDVEELDKTLDVLGQLHTSHEYFDAKVRRRIRELVAGNPLNTTTTLTDERPNLEDFFSEPVEAVKEPEVSFEDQVVLNSSEKMVNAARHVLWIYGPREHGHAPGSFTHDLIETWAKADHENHAKLSKSFPELGLVISIFKNVGVEPLIELVTADD
jgi:hypothetical protein